MASPSGADSPTPPHTPSTISSRSAWRTQNNSAAGPLRQSMTTSCCTIGSVGDTDNSFSAFDGEDFDRVSTRPFRQRLPSAGDTSSQVQLPLFSDRSLERSHSYLSHPTPDALTSIPTLGSTTAPAPQLIPDPVSSPSSHSPDEIAQLEKRDAIECDDYDWATFVFAYSRGRWDPSSVPRPPGKSTDYPEYLTRISLGQQDATSGPKSLPDDSCLPPGSSARRLSLGYVEPESTTRRASDGPDITSEPEILPISRGSLASTSDASRRPSSAAMELTPSQEQRQEAQAILQTISTHSAPNVTVGAHRLSLAQLSLVDEIDRPQRSSSVSVGAYSTPDQIPSLASAVAQHLVPRDPDSRRRLRDDSVWHTSPEAAQANGSSSRSSPGSAKRIERTAPSQDGGETSHVSVNSSSPTSLPVDHLRPALLSEISAMDLSASREASEGTGKLNIHSASDGAAASTPGRVRFTRPWGDGPIEGDHLDMTEDMTEGDTETPPARPGPTPVQLTSPSDVAMARRASSSESAIATLSEVILRHASEASAESIAAGAALFISDRPDESDTIAGLRRAAQRRTSNDPSPSLSDAATLRVGQLGHSVSYPGALPKDARRPSQIILETTPPARHLQSPSKEAGPPLSPPSKSPETQEETQPMVKSQTEPPSDRIASATTSDAPQSTPAAKAPLPASSAALPHTSDTAHGTAPPPFSTQPGGKRGRRLTAMNRTGRPGDLKNPGSSLAMKGYIAAGRRAEQFFQEHGYLPSIYPPNELDRRQALRRYGPSKAAKTHLHFDRIAHLVKLVFNAKIVLISLVGESEQIFQTEAGGGGDFAKPLLQKSAGARDCSFCSHAILQSGDEPIVVLDTLRDWRFAGNPLVVGSPHIRFYAGCPLRTADGFNLGSLCIIDDKPWPEFTPRQRHTLREFGRVAMREMELMRDRLQLGMRDRMQTSIEQYTRDCLEMDSEDTDTSSGAGSFNNSEGGAKDDAQAHGGSGVHRVCDMAARTMKAALQASGAVLFDLSHFELIDLVSQGDGTGNIFYPTPYMQYDEVAANATSMSSASPSTAEHASPSLSDTISDTGKQSTAGTSWTHDDQSLPPKPNLPRPGSGSGSESPLGSREGSGLHAKTVPPMAILGSCEDSPAPAARSQPVLLSHHVKIAEFLRTHRAGQYYPFAPAPLSHILPTGVTNLLLVPIFGLNKQPFALLCAYSGATGEDASSLEEVKESGLQYLRAMGMIILSAVLKKDVMLADKAKSHFISNISHELRTPLHGILAAAELLTETRLNATQDSYLETIEACGKSLLELVNHVLDFTKLSGGASRGGGGGPKSKHSKCDLVKLVQEVCESSWIGQMAKALESAQQSGIGSFYAPPPGSTIGESNGDAIATARGKRQLGAAKSFGGSVVETVIDVGNRSSGWLVNCDTGGIRRVLMNLIGNSLKFTDEGFVHVALRQAHSTETHVVVELSVTDTGRGISRAFLEEQLFHPFTQENPLGTGTGLGLSIVNSIVQSPSINGKIDVWSTVGQGTEIRITCELELGDAEDAEGTTYQPAINVEHRHTVTFLGFNSSRGQEDLKEVFTGYFVDWWGFDTFPVPKDRESSLEDPSVPCGDIVLINEDVELLRIMQERKPKNLPPVIFLTGARGDPNVTAACDEYHRAGGVARMLFKPAGPAKLEAVLDFCLQCLDRIEAGDPLDEEETNPSSRLPSPAQTPTGGLDGLSSPDSASSKVESHGSSSGSGGYFALRAPRRSAEDDATPRHGDDMTPSAAALTAARSGRIGHGTDLTPRLDDVSESQEVHRYSQHISSPTLAGSGSTSLMRRHSAEDRGIVLTGGRKGVTVMSSTEPSSSSGGAGHAAVSRLGRPIMPARSITYHEPRLHKHVLVSPLAPPGSRRADEGKDYFNRNVSSPGSPSSPGSTISLEGGDGAVLKTAIHPSRHSRTSSSSSSTTTSSSYLGSDNKRRMQVLSVEDNPINRRVIAAFLTKMDIDFVEATDGEEGVKVFESYPAHYFDVVLMDLSMPVLDGIGATAAIRRIEADRTSAALNASWSSAESRGTASTASSPRTTKLTLAPATPIAASSSPPSAHTGSLGRAAGAAAAAAAAAANAKLRTKIFALTGRSSDDDKRQAFAMGADGYIVKPVSFKVLSSLLKMLAR